MTTVQLFSRWEVFAHNPRSPLFHLIGDYVTLATWVVRQKQDGQEPEGLNRWDMYLRKKFPIPVFIVLFLIWPKKCSLSVAFTSQKCIWRVFSCSTVTTYATFFQIPYSSRRFSTVHEYWEWAVRNYDRNTLHMVCCPGYVCKCRTNRKKDKGNTLGRKWDEKDIWGNSLLLWNTGHSKNIDRLELK